MSPMEQGKCLIISGGPLEIGGCLLEAARRADCVICADGGARHAQALGVSPRIVLGDFDSLTQEDLQAWQKTGAQIIRYPREKDFTDTHIALLKALELGYTDIDLLAATGGRIDHTLANLMLLALPEAEKARIRLLEETQIIFRLRKKEVLTGSVGETISIFPLGERVTGIRSQGLGYEVPGGVLNINRPIGVSNCFVAPEAVIEHESGCLIAVRVK